MNESVSNSLNINIKEDLGIGLPNINITSITLSNSIALPRSRQDPHIDHPREVSAPSLQDVKDTLENTSMDVSVKMLFKETIDSDGQFCFISKTDMLKYIGIAIVQCTAPELSRQITNDPRMLKPPHGTVYRNGSSMNGITMEKETILTAIQNASKLYSHAVDNMRAGNVAGTSSTSSQYNVITSAMLNEIPFSREEDSQGNTVYNIPLETKFTIPSNKGGASVDFLSYFAYAYFDVERYIEDTKEKLGQLFGQVTIPLPSLQDYVVGNIASDIVIVNGQLQEDSFVYVDGDGKYFTGYHHTMPDGQIMKGKVHLANKAYKSSDFLTKKTVANAKVIDNRESVTIEKVSFNYSKMSEFITNDDVVISLAQNLGVEEAFKKKLPIVSRFWCSHDIAGKNRFIFSINMENLLLKNTTLPGLLTTIKKSDPEEYKSILSATKILNFKITRMRVKKSNLTSAAASGIVTKSKSEFPMTIVCSRDKDSRLEDEVYLSNMYSPTATAGYKKIGAIKEVFVKGTQNLDGIRTFTGTDLEVGSRNKGEYQYTLHISVSDPVPKYLKDKVDSLSRLLTGAGGNHGWNNYEKMASQSWASDDVLNRFTLPFLKKYNATIAAQTSPTFVYDCIGTYASTLALLNSETDTVAEATRLIKMVSYLVNISSPNTGNPQGVSLVSKLIQDLISKLTIVLRQNSKFKKIKDIKGMTDPHTKAETPNLAGKGYSNSFDFTHVFRKTFEAKDTSFGGPIGYDFLSNNENVAPPNIGGLRVFGKKSIEKRFRDETKKLFAAANSRIVIRESGNDATIYNEGDSINNTKFSFLAPSYAYLPNRNPFGFFNNRKSHYKKQADLMLDVMRYKRNPAGGFSSIEIQNSDMIDLPIRIQRRRADLVAYFADKGCVVQETGPESTSNFSSISSEQGIPPSPAPIATPPSSFNITPQATGQFTTTNSVNTAIFSPASGFHALEPEELEDLQANSTTLMLAGKDIMNSPISPNNLLYSLAVLDDAQFINKSLEPQQRRNSLLFYNLDETQGGETFKNALFAYAFIKAIKIATQQPGKEAQPPLVSAPNHVKSLILTAMGSPSTDGVSYIDKVINKHKKDAFKDPLMNGYLNFNYRIINKIEVFRAFKKKNGSVLVGASRWTRLKRRDILRLGEDEVMLCRQRRYYSQENGVVPPKLLEMPFFDEYFMISGLDSGGGVEFPAATEGLQIPQEVDAMTTIGSPIGTPQSFAFTTSRFTTSDIIEGNEVPDNETESPAYLAGNRTKRRLQQYISKRQEDWEVSNGREETAIRTETTTSNPVNQRGGSRPGSPPPKRRKAEQQRRALRKLDLFKQIEILDALNMSEMASAVNINANVSQQKVNGEIASNEQDLTLEEINLLKGSLDNKVSKEMMEKIASNAQAGTNNVQNTAPSSTRTGGGRGGAGGGSTGGGSTY